jgi:oligoribonuclease NrnB/cAMP/cGMP phosphodiesterase (DHH superfamily)
MTDLSRRPLVIYHGDCFDGFASAWAVRHFFGLDVEYHAGRYGEPPPDCKGRKVWMVDFSYPREILMEKVLIPSMQTTVYDHHKTAEKALEGIKDELWKRGIQRTHDKIVFDMHRSGAGITYDELEVTHGKKRGFHTPRYNGQRRERLIDYIEDRDLWRFKLPNSREVSAYITTVPFTFEAYDELAADLNLAPSFSKIAEKGEAIMKYIDVYGEKARAHAVTEKVGGYDVPTINVPYMNCSEHVGKLAEKTTAAFAAGYFRRDDGKWQFSLRSIGDFDVSDIAKSYGGGGHKNSAGFEVETLPWENQIEDMVSEKKEFMELKPHDDSYKEMPGKMPITIADNSAEVEDTPKDEEVEFED